jgi:hypothetical protein
MRRRQRGRKCWCWMLIEIVVLLQCSKIPSACSFHLVAPCILLHVHLCCQHACRLPALQVTSRELVALLSQQHCL